MEIFKLGKYCTQSVHEIIVVKYVMYLYIIMQRKLSSYVTSSYRWVTLGYARFINPSEAPSWGKSTN